jgi:hypothetical protein
MSAYDPLRTFGALAQLCLMFDFYHWAGWACEQAAALRQTGLMASYTFTEESKASSNPSFFVDVDSEQNVGQMIVWSTGDYDATVLLNGSPEAHPIRDLPQMVTNETFESVFARFLQIAKA